MKGILGEMVSSTVRIPTGEVLLDGDLHVPAGAPGVVLFVHGSGSSRHSPRNRFVAETIRDRGIGTLLFDLLTEREEQEERYSRHLRFDIGMLAARLIDATQWLLDQPGLDRMAIGYFGASTGGGAALVAAAGLGRTVDAVVSRGGRPDLAGDALGRVTSPTLLIVGGGDPVVLDLNRRAFADLRCQKELSIIAGASHLFEESGAIEQVARRAARWFETHLGRRDRERSRREERP